MTLLRTVTARGAMGPAGPPGLQGEPGDPGATALGTFIASGATVAWVSGYTFRVGAASYYIAGVFCAAVEQQIALAAADGTFDRIDALTLNAAGELAVVQGTAAAAPSLPSVDPLLAVQVTFVYVTANTTEAPVIGEAVYQEGAEWTVTPSAGTLVVDSTNSPRSGSKCIEGTNVSGGQYCSAVRGSGALDLAEFNLLVFYIKLKAAWNIKRTMQLAWYAGSSRKGVVLTIGTGSHGLDVTNVTDYQQIVVSLRDFLIAPGTLVDTLRLTWAGTAGSNLGFYLDDVSLQAGLTGGQAQQTLNYRGAWSGTVSYAAGDIVYYLNSSYLCLLAHLNQVPGLNSQYWGVLALGPQPASLESTGNVVAAASSQTFNRTGFVNAGLVYYLKVEETGGAMTSTYDVAVYGRDTCLAADLMYLAEGIDPASAYEDFLPWFYSDRDQTQELHLLITNSDALQAGTFAVTVNAEAYA